MTCSFSLNDKHVLIVSNSQSDNVVGIINACLLENANVTLIAPSVKNQIHPVISKLFRSGYIGYLPKIPTISDSLQHHLTIVTAEDSTWKAQFIQACHHQRQWLYVVDDLKNSNVQLNLDVKINSSNVLDDHIQSDLSSQSTLNSSGDMDVSFEPITDEATTNTISYNQSTAKKPTLYLVGVGPGSPDLITLKAQRLLHSVPVIISDRLVSENLFDSLPSSTRLLFSHKVCGKAPVAQKQINDWIVEHLNQGQDVMRVKGGDPFVFGRGGEELNLAKKLGYNVIVVPGISSCISAAAMAGIPVTHRGVADSFVVCTGQKEDGSWSGVPMFAKNRTLVLLMAIGVLGKLRDQLKDHHDYPIDIPVAVIFRATYPDQKIVFGTLIDIAQKVVDEGIKSHATVIVGHVVNCLIK
ncbi:tetrapyrrole methylase [Globomyces pollinis-pini]|nr:tetrapyrrole methylase [Globomyces pollinis-pini]